jgi:hypothetical protein
MRASCANMVMADSAFIDQVIGLLADATLRQIQECLKMVLEIR